MSLGLQSEKIRLPRTRASADWLPYLMLAVIFVLLLSHGLAVMNRWLGPDVGFIGANRVWSGPLRPLLLNEFNGGPETAGLGQYRPLLTAPIWAIHQLIGSHPFLWRILGIAAFIGVAALVLALGWNLTGRMSVGLLAAVLLAAHPAKAELVLFASNAAELALIAAPAGALMVWVALRRKPTAALALVPLLLGALVHDLGGLLLAVIGPLLVISSGRYQRPAMVAALVLSLLVLAGLRLVAVVGLPGWHAPFSVDGSFAAFTALMGGIKAVMVPSRPSFFITPIAPEGGGIGTLLALVVIIGAGAALVCWLMKTRRPVLAILLAWGIVGSWGLPSAAAQGLTYSDRFICLAPWLLLASIGIRTMVQNLPPMKVLVPIGATGWIALGVIAGLDATMVCRTPVRFWERISKENPDLVEAQVAVAQMKQAEGDWEGLRQVVVRLVERAPTHPQTQALALELAVTEIGTGKGEEGLHWAEWVLSRDPENARAWRLRAAALGQLRQWPEARAAIDKAISLEPDSRAGRFIAARLQVFSPDVEPKVAAAAVAQLDDGSGRFPLEWREVATILSLREEASRMGPEVPLILRPR